MDSIDWVAGVLEGEGYFGLTRQGRSLVIQLTMTDRDIVDRVHETLGTGRRNERTLPSGKTAYCLTIAAQKETEAIMNAVLPMMGERRAAKIRHCLSEHAKVPPPKRDWTHCKSGHLLAGDNLKMINEGKYLKRRCVECGKLRQRKYRAKAENASGIFGL